MKLRHHTAALPSPSPWRLISVLLLLLVYVAGTMPVDSLHALLHAHEAVVLHTAADESDACHQTLFHQATKADKGCDHKTHVTKTKSCPLCHLVLHADHNLPQADEITILRGTTQYAAAITHGVVSLPALHTSSRAPPLA